MNNDTLSKVLKLLIIGLAISGLVIYLFIFPFIGKSFIEVLPEASSWYWPWLSFLWITGIPCFMVLILMWQFTSTIKDNKVFSRLNATRILNISKLSILDTIIVIVGNLILLFADKNHPSIMILMLAIILLGITIAIIAYAFSRLIYNAAILQEESDLTI